jgi:cbb3-type cytochrome oxidase maturation protein
MDLSIYLIIATFAVFFTGALVALAWSIASGQWRDLSSAALIIFDEDDPYPGQHDSLPAYPGPNGA